MKILRSVSYVLMALGVIVFLTGLFYRIQHWPDIFCCIISGPILTFTGAVAFIVTLVRNKKSQ